MGDNMNKKKVLIIASIFMIIVLLSIGTSYALFRINVTKNTDFKLKVGNLELTINDNTNTFTDGKLIINNMVPTKESDALQQTGYNFTLTNTGTIDAKYKIYLDDAMVSGSTRLSDSLIKVNITNTTLNQSRTVSLNELTNRIIDTGTITKNTSYNYTLRVWLDYNAGNEAANKYFGLKLRIDGQQANEKEYAYIDPILNGADPVLTDNLIPVTIDNTGVVKKADITKDWYSYENKKWANAVVLKDNTVNYTINQTIPESNIESYFVWIPKYSYKLFDIGNYNSTTTSVDIPADFESKAKAIDIRFGLTNTTDTSTECATPLNQDGTQALAGESGNCAVGKYMTHPAFITMNSNGLWVGKFETGYEGTAPGNTYDTSKIVVKPNVYSWRSMTVGNMFKNSYNYMREEDSHMMKNTEWGAMAYLSHSIYGTCNGSSCTDVRINNNRSYVTGFAAIESPTKPTAGGTSIEGNRIEAVNPNTDGTYAINYLNTASQVASTTLNYTGIYDTSGVAHEYVAGYTTNAVTNSSTNGDLSEITSLYNDFYNDSNYLKYWDIYLSTGWQNYNNRILGDATGEMGPFIYTQDLDSNGSGGYNYRNKSSWYFDSGYFVHSTSPWFTRGLAWSNGIEAGTFAFSTHYGSATSGISFRLVLAPRED